MIDLADLVARVKRGLPESLHPYVDAYVEENRRTLEAALRRRTPEMSRPTAGPKSQPWHIFRTPDGLTAVSVATIKSLLESEIPGSWAAAGSFTGSDRENDAARWYATYQGWEHIGREEPGRRWAKWRSLAEEIDHLHRVTPQTAMNLEMVMTSTKPTRPLIAAQASGERVKVHVVEKGPGQWFHRPHESVEVDGWRKMYPGTPHPLHVAILERGLADNEELYYVRPTVYGGLGSWDAYLDLARQAITRRPNWAEASDFYARGESRP